MYGESAGVMGTVKPAREAREQLAQASSPILIGHTSSITKTLLARTISICSLRGSGSFRSNASNCSASTSLSSRPRQVAHLEVLPFDINTGIHKVPDTVCLQEGMTVPYRLDVAYHHHSPSASVLSMGHNDSQGRSASNVRPLEDRSSIQHGAYIHRHKRPPQSGFSASTQEATRVEDSAFGTSATPYSLPSSAYSSTCPLLSFDASACGSVITKVLSDAIRSLVREETRPEPDVALAARQTLYDLRQSSPAQRSVAGVSKGPGPPPQQALPPVPRLKNELGCPQPDKQLANSNNSSLIDCTASHINIRHAASPGTRAPD